ncbi:MAG: methyltransferase [Desulfarculaceae bacterium]|nr:methyltransferase [Desulfarculaceae bacterium]
MKRESSNKPVKEKKLIYMAREPLSGFSDALYADFDVVRLSLVGANNRQAILLDKIDGLFSSIVIAMPAQYPKAQLKADLANVGRLLAPGGQAQVILPSPKVRNMVRTLARKFFDDVFLEKHCNVILLSSPTIGTYQIEELNWSYTPEGASTELLFTTVPGLFSYKHPDLGSSLLISCCDAGRGESVMDVGCGYGLLGVSLAARGCSVTMMDSDARAVRYSIKNLEQNGLTADVRHEYILSKLALPPMDYVVSNPPTHAGSDILRQLFMDMAKLCKPGGQLLIVIREQLNYEKWLAPLGRLEKVGSQDGFKVLRLW